MAEDDDIAEALGVESLSGSTANQMALVVEGMDQVIELLCIYRDKLFHEGFSEEAVEAMVVVFHDHLRS